MLTKRGFLSVYIQLFISFGKKTIMYDLLYLDIFLKIENKNQISTVY